LDFTSEPGVLLYDGEKRPPERLPPSASPLTTTLRHFLSVAETGADDSPIATPQCLGGIDWAENGHALLDAASERFLAEADFDGSAWRRALGDWFVAHIGRRDADAAQDVDDKLSVWLRVLAERARAGEPVLDAARRMTEDRLRSAATPFSS
ncbi:MAG: hypothetical protein AAF684_06110, partial [Pseudomonadota bacterium]